MKKILIFSILVSFISFVVAHTEEGFGHHTTGFMMGDWMMGNYGTGWWFFGWILGILIIIVLVLFIVWLIKQIQKK